MTVRYIARHTAIRTTKCVNLLHCNLHDPYMPHISPPPPSLLRKIKSSNKYATSGRAVVTPEPLASDRRVNTRAPTVLSAVSCNAQTLFYLPYIVGLFLSDVVFKCLEQTGDSS